MSIIARLGVILGINTAEFNKGLDDAIKKTKDFEKNQKQALKNAQQAQDEFMATASKGLAGVAAAAYLVGQAFKYADDIEDTAAAFDVTTQSLLALKAAMQGAGGDANNVGTALQKLASAQQDAREGSDEMRDAFTKLGISGKDVEKLSLPDMFKRVAQELAKVENTTERTALQQQLLGKAMKGVDVRTFVDKYKEMGDPALLSAIQENAKAWDNIEAAFKNILLFAQKLVSPLAAIVNSMADIADTMDNLSKGGSTEIDWGAGELGGMPGTAITHGYGAAPGGKKTTIAPKSEAGAYSTQSARDKAAAKKAADDAKQIQEARKQLQLEIDLIKNKADISEKMFAVNSKGIVLGENAISQEKMLLDLASSIADIRSNAAKERLKDKAQVDLINQKEQEQIAARVAQFGYENGLRMQQRQREHELAIQTIRNESESIHNAQTVQTFNALELLNLESQKFKLGSDAYEITKLQVEENNKLRDIHLKAAEAVKQITTEYELSAKSAEDLQLYEENILKINGEIFRQLNYTVLLEEKKRDNLKEQQELQKQMFALDLAQQKGRDIASIQSTLNIEKQMLQLQGNRYLMSTNQYNLSTLALENIHRLIEAEKKYNDQMKEAEYEMKRQGGGQKAREEYEQRIKTIEQVRDIELDAIDQINNARQSNLEKEIERQKSFTEGWNSAARQFRENSENAFKRGEAAFASVMNNMDSAIGKFVETGKFKFEEFAIAVIKDLIRMEMQAQATMLFRSIVGFFSPAPITTMNYDAGVGTSVGFAAAGGAINAPTIVGENGAELFVPNTPGTIIPNGSWQQAAASMGNSGFTNNGTYIANMSAIDTQSATQFLATNKNTIWAAYQSANRSVPLSR
jgi:lambda family phage tail tape measure protein